MGHVGQGLVTEFLDGSRDFSTPGASGIDSAGIICLPSGSSVSTINAALVSHSIVYLKPGMYNFGTSDQIVIPDHKQLIGLAAGVPANNANAEAVNRVYLLWSGTVTVDSIKMGAGTALKDIILNYDTTPLATGLTAVDGAFNQTGENWVTIERVSVHKFASSSGNAFTLRNGQMDKCVVEEFSGGPFPRAVYLLNKTGLGQSKFPTTSIEDCTLVGGEIGFAVVEFEDSVRMDRTTIRHCNLSSRGGDIFRKTGSIAFGDVKILNCSMFGPSAIAGTHGFNGFGGAGGGVQFNNNLHNLNNGAGSTMANLTAAGAGLGAEYIGNVSRSMGAADSIGANWFTRDNRVA